MKQVLVIGGSSAIGQGLKYLFNPDKYETLFVNSGQISLPRLAYSELWDGIDVVINLASITTDSELWEGDSLDEALLDVNCLGAVKILNTFLPQMRMCEYGRIIMMSSVFSEINIKGQGLYSASKAFVDKLVKIAALENAEYGITVNSIQLGYTGIGMGKMTEENAERALNKIAMKRFCTMEELYKTIDYIIETEYLTGQNIRLDGGIR
jgi:NAD(P)-dependent dehydrogenase (short-subunit alcohol dehydrogenase family)